MKEYLEQRIIHLKNVEMEFWDKQYQYPSRHALRSIYRKFSNEFCARRQECEETLKFLNDSADREAQRSGIEP